MARFFISTPLGAETVCLSELKYHWPQLLGSDARPHGLPLPSIEMHKGGLEFEVDLFIGLQLNFFLKAANRILLRLDSFRVRDLPKFYNRLKSLPWQDYLVDSDVEFEIAAQKSRLNNEKRLLESARQALAACFAKDRASPQSKKMKQKIYIRLFDDQCWVSLDSSGEHLHKRGWAPLKGEAPLRETLACFLLWQMISVYSVEDLGSLHLVDPMMGSGTFLTEARALFDGNFLRPYAFQDWKKCPKLFQTELFYRNYKIKPGSLFASYIGNDLNPKMVEVANGNWQSLEEQLQKTQAQNFAPARAQFAQGDSLQKQESVVSPSWLILNPPYGERLGANEKGIGDLLEKLCINYKPLILGVLWPENQANLKIPAGWSLQKRIKVNNGGIHCVFSILTQL